MAKSAAKTSTTTPKTALKAISKPNATGKTENQKVTTGATDRADLLSAPVAVDLHGKNVCVAGVLMWSEKDETTWWITQEKLKKVLLELDAKLQPAVNGSTDLILLGTTKRDPSWEGSNKQTAYSDRKKSTPVYEWLKFLKYNDDLKDLVRDNLACARFDSSKVPRGATSRTAKVLHAAFMKQKKEAKKAEESEDED